MRVPVWRIPPSPTKIRTVVPSISGTMYPRRRLANLLQHLPNHTSSSSSSPSFSSSLPPISRSQTSKPNRAAVLICLFEGDAGEMRVILTKRASNMSSHSGEVALPGGKAEEGDADDAATAMREAKEEIGLDPSTLNVMAVLEPFSSKHLLRVVPVIAILSDRKAFNPVPNASEVEAIFDAPLEMFLKEDNWSAKEIEWNGRKSLLHCFDFEWRNEKFVIWGLTAGILIRAASVVYQRSPSFADKKPQN